MTRIALLTVFVLGLSGCASIFPAKGKHCVINTVYDGIYCKADLDSRQRRVVFDFCSDRDFRVDCVIIEFSSHTGNNVSLISHSVACGKKRYAMKKTERIVYYGNYDNLSDVFFDSIISLRINMIVTDENDKEMQMEGYGLLREF